MQGSFISISEGYLSYENRHQNERFQVSIKKLPKENLVEILIFSVIAFALKKLTWESLI